MNQISFDDLFAEVKKETIDTPTLTPLQHEVMDLIQSGKTSALEICEKLIESGKLSNERYTTNKPKAYGKVCSILESFVVDGTLKFIEDKDKKDRTYEKVTI
ncbi:DUF3895 domain-containing protein (plasmid) [Bacillus sp. S3]|uniref:DUF3895 domain-containing protein n=1 Tax=Bacillus sp. S3 TaxID=486398 RepID=UPI00118967DD|nr:DUF3895 domain-containing protein [Bacillus sp. S3]QCJ45519.1 DUF3895 domain-containing protein [Bacillus sp. S3]